MDFQAKVEHLPARPGVYLLKDDRGRVLYVGKAKNLRVRVRTYLRPGADGRQRVRFLMNRVSDLDWVVTDTEKEALILENTLIKRHRPRYNVDLRDDKTYLSLRLDVQSPFPRLSMVRQVKRDGALYLGPYSSARSLRETVDLIQRIFPLRQCRDRTLRPRARPCLYGQVRGCRAPCCGRITEEAYREIVDQVVAFLKGRAGSLLDDLKRRMAGAADRLAFEEAAQLRDRIRAVELTLERQKAVTHRPVDRDVIALVRDAGASEVVVLVIRAGNLIDRRAYGLDGRQADAAEVLAQFLRRYYRGDRIVPAEVVVSEPLPDDEAGLLEDWLGDRRGRRVRVTHPKRGEKAALVRLARENAAESLAERWRTRAGAGAALDEVRDRLGLGRSPRRIECFDVSNVHGHEAVASRVLFEDGLPRKDGYRRFRVKTVSGADDYAMLYEVISRRLARQDRPGWELPDLLLVDGGKGQLGMAVRAVADAGIEGLAVAGIAKARTRPGRGGDPGGATVDRLFLPGRTNPVVFPPRSAGLLLLQRVRDEAHRFAVSYHRRRRRKATLASALDGIPGVGEKRRAVLLRRFGSLDGLRAAGVDEIAAVPGIPRAVAERIADGLAGDGT